MSIEPILIVLNIIWVVFHTQEKSLYLSMETSESTTRKHIGRKISRIRELRGMKQEALALGVS